MRAQKQLVAIFPFFVVRNATFSGSAEKVGGDMDELEASDAVLKTRHSGGKVSEGLSLVVGDEWEKFHCTNLGKFMQEV